MALPLRRGPSEEPTPAAAEVIAPPDQPKPKRLARTISLAVALAIWFIPAPGGLTPQAWHLFAIFAATILSVVIGAFPILTASVFAIAAAVLSGTLPAADAYAGFSNPTIVLIIVAFLVARAVVKSGLGERLGYRAISLFGRSSLGLSYSIFAVDALISPAFPSNTARSGVLYPLAFSMAQAAGATPERHDRRRFGQFLMFSGMASLSLSSALWLTAMAGNPLGAAIAREYGVQIGFGDRRAAHRARRGAGRVIVNSRPTCCLVQLVGGIPRRLVAACSVVLDCGAGCGHRNRHCDLRPHGLFRSGWPRGGVPHRVGGLVPTSHHRVELCGGREYSSGQSALQRHVAPLSVPA